MVCLSFFLAAMAHTVRRYSLSPFRYQVFPYA